MARGVSSVPQMTSLFKQSFFRTEPKENPRWLWSAFETLFRSTYKLCCGVCCDHCSTAKINRIFLQTWGTICWPFALQVDPDQVLQPEKGKTAEHTHTPAARIKTTPQALGTWIKRCFKKKLLFQGVAMKPQQPTADNKGKGQPSFSQKLSDFMDLPLAKIWKKIWTAC